MAMIEATGVCKHFGGISALSGAAFSAEAGEVHALIGENGAGKSTFIQILAGAIRPNSGTILLRGKPHHAANPLEARAAGIAVVFQELSLVPDLTVEQNIWLLREEFTPFGTVRAAEMRSKTRDLFAKYQFPAIDPSTDVRRLSLADRQIVEIAKALAGAPDVLILDEATSALAPRETDWLLRLVRRLAADGMLVVYISHRFAEIRNVANRITVFRNGATVATHETAAVTDNDVIGEMLGRRMDRLYPERRPAATERLALKVRNLVSGDRLGPIDLDLHEGEVLGVAGMQGHGQRELFHALFGVGHAKGEIERWGEGGVVRGPRQALAGRNGVALVPEDRREQGLLLSKSIRENLSLAVASRFVKFGFLNATQERAQVLEMMNRLQIKAASGEQLAGTLSGGNQQKVIFGKMLMTEARILLLFDPTRGVDVGTKGEIFRLIRDLAAQGYAILFYSSDLPELVHVADRVAVMRNGRIVATLQDEQNSESGILRAAMFESEAA